mgnify:CR=1 FL=1
MKYVHEVFEKDTLGAVVGEGIGEQEMQLRTISINLKEQIDVLLRDLKKMNNDPKAKRNIEMIERFLIDMKGFV